MRAPEQYTENRRRWLRGPTPALARWVASEVLPFLAPPGVQCQTISPQTPGPGPLCAALQPHQCISMLPVPGPGSGQPFPYQYLVDAVSPHGVKVKQEAATGVSGPRPGLHPDRAAGQLPQPAGGLTVTTLPPFRSVYPEQAYTSRRALEGVAIDDPGNRQRSAVGTLELGGILGDRWRRGAGDEEQGQGQEAKPGACASGGLRHFITLQPCLHNRRDRDNSAHRNRTRDPSPQSRH